MRTRELQRVSRILGLGVAGSLVILLTAPIPAGAQRPLRMVYDGDAVVVGDLDPGAEVVALVVSRSARDFVPFNERRDETWSDDDGDGVVRIPLAAPVPPKTVVIAVELASGRFDIWKPDDSPGREVALPTQALGPGSGNGFERLEYRGSYLELMLVRAGDGSGVWGLTTGDGAAADESPSSDGMVVMRPRSMAPLRESAAAPETYEVDDLLFGVSPIDMEYFAVRIRP